jgi:hypothetical protein
MLIVNTCLTDRSFPTEGAPNKSQLVALPQTTFTGPEWRRKWSGQMRGCVAVRDLAMVFQPNESSEVRSCPGQAGTGAGEHAATLGIAQSGGMTQQLR